MRNRLPGWIRLGLWLVGLSPLGGFAQSALIPQGAVWKYLDNGSDQGAAWKEPAFDDTIWKSAPARFGYGGDGEKTIVGFGPDPNRKFATTYFRRAFDVADPASFPWLTLSLLRDDGAVVYLNGTEVRRDNMPAGLITSTTFASASIPNADEQVFFPSTLSANWLVRGRNVLAVEIHQANLTSSDLSFDLELRGPNVAPSVSLVNPAPNASLPAGASLTLTAMASDSDGTIAKVEFFQGRQKLGEAINPPFSVTWSNVPEGNYLLTAVATDNEGAPGTSAAVTLSVSDPSPPRLVAAIGGADRVTVTFSKALASVTATNLTHYTTDAGLRVLGANLGAAPNIVILQTTALKIGAAYTLTVSGVADSSGQAIAPNSKVSFTFVPFSFVDIGGPALSGSLAFAEGIYSSIAGGNDIGGSGDQCFLSYQRISGNFDLQLRLAGVSASDAWAKAGLMARESLEGNSRMVAILGTPSLSGCVFEARATTGGVAVVNGGFPVNYPNTWLRLERVGNQFNGYASFDALSWTRVGSVTLALPASVYFGLSAASHSATQMTTARWRDWEATAVRTVANARLPWEPLGPSSRKTGLVISEIHYKPAPRPDGKVLEFIEVFNSNPFFENIGGYRLSGDIDFTFPPQTVLLGGAFLVIARKPADLQSVYGITNVLGPYRGSLKTSGTVRLRSDAGAVLLEVPYENDPPWPVAADGTGHSLVLARPSSGEGFAEAWAASDAVGGSPGAVESYHPSPQRPVVINEFLAHTDAPLRDFIELYNHGNEAVDLSGCILTDDASTNQFSIPKGTVIAARGYAVFDEGQLGFALNAAGETIYFKNSDQSRVLDAVRFEPQENGVSMGRFPDGAEEFYPLRSPTPAAANAASRIHPIAINEIMYAPLSDDARDQYLELLNQGSEAIDLSGWRLARGVSFTIPTNTVLGAGQYLVVAKDAARLQTRYPGLTAARVIGNFEGTLSGRGERLVLAKPDPLLSTNALNVVVTNTIYVVVDEVTYRTGGRWGNWAHGGGSSLELRDPRSNHRLAANWADSDETAKAPWTTIEVTGVLDNGSGYNGGPIDNLQVVMLGEAECLLDDVEVFRPGSTNLIANSNFETDLTGWNPQGNHVRSSWETAQGFNGGRSLHIRASARGDTGANRLWSRLGTSPSPNQTLTIRAKARWLRGWPELVLRVHGNWLEAFGSLAVPPHLGTPGARNSQAVSNAGPAIAAVSHFPILPAANQAVVVTARLQDPDGVASAQLKYRVDPATAYASAAMRDDGTGGDAVAGDGLYAASLPAQAAGALVAFYVEAADSRGGLSTFPDDAPNRECLVRFGDPTPSTGFGVYRQWFTQKTIATWNNRPTLSNERLDGTFVYGDFRVIYNFSSRYAGSPYHQGFGSPLSDGHYSIEFPLDDLLLGTENFNKIHAPGNGPFDDNTIQREQICFWIARQLGLPWNYRRYVAMYVNGTRRSTLMEDTQVPGAEMMEEYFPDDSDGFLHKLQPWFEFDNANSRTMGFSNNSWCALNKYTTTGGVKKLARYRWNYLVRAAHGTANNYTNVFALVDAANIPGNPGQAASLEHLADMEEWMRIFAVRHAVGDWDSFGTQNSQNMYGYKPLRGKWTLFIWDMNIVLGNSGSWSAGQNLFTVNGSDPAMQRIYNNPPFRRAYWRALKEIATGAMGGPRIGEVLDAKYASFRAESINVTSPATLKSWMASARTSILSQAAAVDAAALTLTGSTSLTTSDNLVLLTGTAPVEVSALTVNGVAYPVTWTSVTGWSMRVPVLAGRNRLVLAGRNLRGEAVANASVPFEVLYSGPAPLPEDQIAVNEILYAPTVPGASFVELYNRSPDVTLDLSRFRLHGVDYTFPDGSLFGPRSYLVLAKDRVAFAAAHGSEIPVFGEFAGKLDPDGETLTLIKPGATSAEDVEISRVRYENQAPWPVLAPNGGASLQLIDSARDVGRVGNWAASETPPLSTPGRPNSGQRILTPFPPLWINEVGLESGNGPEGAAGWPAPWIELYNQGTNSVLLDDLFLADNFTNLTQWAFPSGLQIKPGEFKLIWADGQEALARDAELHAGFTLSQGSGSIALSRSSGGTPQVLDYLIYRDVRTGRSYGSFPDGQPFARREFFVPTLAQRNNPVSAPLTVVINEWMAGNTGVVIDPADGHDDDWFELFNFGTNKLDLAGYYLTDNLTNPFSYRIPGGYAIPPKGYLLVWADGEPGQNNAARADLHAGFKLAKDGGQIGLFGEDGTLMDSVVFGPQTSDASQGRFPDGPSTVGVMIKPTPREANLGKSIEHAPRFRHVSMLGNQLTLQWDAVAGSTYRIQFKSDLSDLGWGSASGDILARGDAVAFEVDLGGGGRRFFRVVSVAQP